MKNAATITRTASSGSANLTQDDLKTLKAAFSKDRLGVKVQSFNRERTRAMLVQYLQHTDVQDRLEEVDPAWSSEVMHEERVGDTTYVRVRLTVKGVARENVGEGGDPKAAYSDALKRCAMLFGVGRYLYDAPTVWTEYDESRDRFKQWSPEDYDAALERIQAREARSKPVAPSKPQVAASTGKGIKPKSDESTSTRPREELNRVLLNLYRPYLSQFPQTQFAELLKARYNVAETRFMSVEQLEDLVAYMEQKLQSVA